MNAVRVRAFEILERTIDDFTDAELMQRAPDELWYLDVCIDQLHRLPSEIDPIILCREYTALQARAIVKRAQHDLTQRVGSNNALTRPLGA